MEQGGAGTGVIWRDDALRLELVVADGTATIASSGSGMPADPLSAVEVLTTDAGRVWRGERGVHHGESVVGHRLRYRRHRTLAEAGWNQTTVTFADPVTGLYADLVLRTMPGLGVLRSHVRLLNAGPRPVQVEEVTSLHLGGLGPAGRLDVLWAENDWLAECRWRRVPLRDRLPDVIRSAYAGDPRSRLRIAGAGGWSTDGHLPMGALVDRDTGRAWLWQVEHQGAWLWRIAERHDGAFLALTGPTDLEHQWRLTLAPDESFTTVPVALAAGDAGFEDACARLTRYRRAIRRPHADHAALSVVFNDYMNTLMGDPTTEKLLPLVAAAARAGAEYFVIDAGWYADADGWWDAVGAWTPSRTRFPGGIEGVIADIRARGMVPGLWLEPEVVGVRSPIADALPAAAFFQRGGVRVAENGRYHLDFRHPAARKHLDTVVDTLVGELGVGYLKLDYNINPGAGTDASGQTPGAGLLGHNRAYLEWIEGVLDRHPGLVVENCGSGGLRLDHAILRLAQLQSTSDQQDFRRYAAIAAAAPTAVTPEQGAVWAYPQPDFSDDETVFTLCNSLLGRVHLSGHVDEMTEERLALVAEAVAAYKRIRADLPRAVPFWPLGLPGWTDPWLALGLRAPDVTYLTVWHREGSDTTVDLPVPHLAGVDVAVEAVYPSSAAGAGRWYPGTATLAVDLPRTPTAVTLALR